MVVTQLRGHLYRPPDALCSANSLHWTLIASLAKSHRYHISESVSQHIPNATSHTPLIEHRINLTNSIKLKGVWGVLTIKGIGLHGIRVLWSFERVWDTLRGRVASWYGHVGDKLGPCSNTWFTLPEYMYFNKRQALGKEWGTDAFNCRVSSRYPDRISNLATWPNTINLKIWVLTIKGTGSLGSQVWVWDAVSDRRQGGTLIEY